MRSVEFGKPIDDKLCLALGFFDGVHAGHRKIIQTAIEHAKECGGTAAVSTFSDRPNKSDSLLTYYDRKKLFESLGAQYCVTMQYANVCGKSGNQFFNELISTYYISELICGEDYKFGHDMCGVEVLRNLCKLHCVNLCVVPLLDIDGVRVSSTVIKLLLRSGKMATANKMLQAPYHITGRIVSGNGIGRNIGTPTVNINPPQGLHPLKEGVYGSYAVIDGNKYRAVTNYGKKPTFDFNNVTIETHLIGYSGGSLEGRDITVYFIKFLRLIRKFKGAEELAAQIKKDTEWFEDAKNRP